MDKLPWTVLLVEDSDLTRRIFRVLLEGLGYTVLEAATAEKAVDLAVRARPDAIITDFYLEGAQGDEFAHRIRATENLGKTPLIAVSSAQDEKTLRRIKSAPFDAFLQKPVAKEQLAETLSMVLKDAKP